MNFKIEMYNELKNRNLKGTLTYKFKNNFEFSIKKILSKKEL